MVGSHTVVISPPTAVASPAAAPIGSRPGTEVDLPDRVRLSPVEDATEGLAGPVEASFEVPEGGTDTAVINVAASP